MITPKCICPGYLGITPAAEHDLEAIRPVLNQLEGRQIFADKAYADRPPNEGLLKNANTQFFTPVKLVKGESRSTRQSKKQPMTPSQPSGNPLKVGSIFLSKKTDAQRASKARNTKGLMLHVFGAIAAALYSWLF